MPAIPNYPLEAATILIKVHNCRFLTKMKKHRHISLLPTEAVSVFTLNISFSTENRGNDSPSRCAAARKSTDL